MIPRLTPGPHMCVSTYAYTERHMHTSIIPTDNYCLGTVEQKYIFQVTFLF